MMALFSAHCSGVYIAPFRVGTTLSAVLCGGMSNDTCESIIQHQCELLGAMRSGQL
jgi:hypothetical protein